MVTYTDAQMVDDLAQQLFVSLTADAPTPPTIDFSDPKYTFDPDLTSDLYQDANEIQLSDLTQVDLAGEGVFDKLMAAVDLHIQREFRGNRITGDQYAKVYTEAMTGVLGSSVQFLLAKDQAHWAAITAQMQARIAEIQATKALIELEETKFNTQKALFEMQNSGGQYALTKMSIATENQKHFLMQAQTDGEVYRVRHLLPAELAIQQYQRMQVLPSSVAINQVQSARILPAEAAIKEYINRELQPIEKRTTAYQIDVAMPIKTNIEEFQRDYLLPAELAIQQYQLMQVLPSSVNINKVQAERILPAEASIKEFINRELQPIERATAAYNLETTLPIKTDIDEFQRDSLLPVQLGQEQHKLDELLPAQTNLVKEQLESQRAQTLNTRSDGVTAVAGLMGKQKDSITADIDSKQFNIDFVLPVQLDLVKEQREAERSKTLDTRVDGTTIVGSVGKQKDLYTQQIDSFIKDAKYKTTKMYLDGWITQKTLDEGLTAPSELTNAEINEVLVANRTANGL